MTPEPFVPEDAAKRRLILTELRTTMLVEAAAGTGKTTSLIGRMVELLAEGACQVHEMAAVTFTRKATAELRARFQVQLERELLEATGPRRERLRGALERIEQGFIGTIHSFCGRLLRERPIEAGVDVAFEELDEHAEFRLRVEAWGEHVAKLHAERSPLLARLEDLGLRAGDLRQAYLDYADYPDVERWPAPDVEIDDDAVAAARAALIDYAEHMRRLAPTLPRFAGNCRIIPQYREVPRLVRQARLDHLTDLMEVLEHCAARSGSAVLKEWPEGREQGRRERARWAAFVDAHARPLVEAWRRRRYGPVLELLDGAARTYAALRTLRGVLSYQDLLMRAAELLRDNPHVRRYFRSRFTHVLVDEFQDTDPVQAQVMMYLTAADPGERSWRACRPVDGSLFVVGDPKQSIYRFRRADIVTYNQVRDIIQDCGRVVPLWVNFRSAPEIISWVNGVSAKLFPKDRDDYSPEDRPMAPGCRRPDAGGEPGVRRLDVPDELSRKDDIVAWEADAIARIIRDAVNRGGRCGDFMIVTPTRAPLVVYAQRLTDYGVPFEVTGGTAVNGVEEVALLYTLLAAVVHPDDEVALAGALRSELFGVSDTELYEFQRAGGRFNYRNPQEGVDVPAPIAEALARLGRYADWLRGLQAAAAIERIAGDVGLFARAAAAVDGPDRSGALCKAVELLRAASGERWTPAALVEYLGALVERDGPPPDEKRDGMPARPHAEPAVRIMNLHQVKGLEAPVVFLAAGAGRWVPEPRFHVDRSADETRGYIEIKGPWRNAPTLAEPDGWPAHQATEANFDAAERKRHLYVAATRAGVQLVITNPLATRIRSTWAELAGEVPDADVLVPPDGVAAPETAAAAVPDGAPAEAAAAIDRRVAGALRPTHEVRQVKSAAVRGSVRSAPGGEHGTEWGTVLHVLLEAAMVRPEADLGPIARAALREHDLEEAMAGEAVAVVRSATRSALWRRACAGRRLVEVPVQFVEPDAPGVLYRGVIDLVFREASGWVIVDYKTDDRPGASVDALAAHYAPQVQVYARAWARLAGEPVSEAGLFFVYTGEYRVVDPAGQRRGAAR